MFKIAFSIAKQYTEIGAICVRAREGGGSYVRLE